MSDEQLLCDPTYPKAFSAPLHVVPPIGPLLCWPFSHRSSKRVTACSAVQGAILPPAYLWAHGNMWSDGGHCFLLVRDDSFCMFTA